MSTLLIVGGGLFGSQAAAYARSKGVEVIVFDPGLEGAASPAAAGLFKESWMGQKLRDHFRRAIPLLDRLHGIRHITLTHDDGTRDPMLFVPPSAILEQAPIRQRVTAVGDGWLLAGGQRHEGWVYIAAGIWCEEFVPGLGVYGKAGATFTFPGEHEGRIRPVAPGCQAIAFVRDPGTTHFSDGTAERNYCSAHDLQSLERAAKLGLTGTPLRRSWGWRPYAAGGPIFKRLGNCTWLGTGGRKLGTVLSASFACRLVEDELGL